MCVCVCACALTPRPEDHVPVAPRACPPLRSCRGPAVTPTSAQVLIPACRDGHSAAPPLSCHLGIDRCRGMHRCTLPPLSCMAFPLPRHPPVRTCTPISHPSALAHRYPARPDVHTDILRLRGFNGYCIMHCCTARGYGLEFFFQTPHYHAMRRYRAPTPDLSHRLYSRLLQCARL